MFSIGNDDFNIFFYNDHEVILKNGVFCVLAFFKFSKLPAFLKTHDPISLSWAPKESRLKEVLRS